MHSFLRFTVFGIIALLDWNVGVNCSLLQFLDFYSQSFVPNGLHISYRVNNGVSINYNITAFQSFPGKILTSIFIRRVSTNPGEKSLNVAKYKNLDFCKIIEKLQNFSMTTQNTTLFQNTFITSCPLIPGFYFIKNGTIRTETIPSVFARGTYWMQIELVQVFGEVTKLMNIKAKCYYEPSISDVFGIFHGLKGLPEVQ